VSGIRTQLYEPTHESLLQVLWEFLYAQSAIFLVFWLAVGVPLICPHHTLMAQFYSEVSVAHHVHTSEPVPAIPDTNCTFHHSENTVDTNLTGMFFLGVFPAGISLYPSTSISPSIGISTLFPRNPVLVPPERPPRS
jgi:hypothetical protein